MKRINEIVDKWEDVIGAGATTEELVELEELLIELLADVSGTIEQRKREEE